MQDVHTEHCCYRHGCCYQNPDCTVTQARAPQSFPCEICDWEEEDIINALGNATTEQLLAELHRRGA